MSDANRVALYALKETTFGVTETGNYKELRFTSESLKAGQNSVVSNELRSDRQRTDTIRTNVSATGDIAFELSYESNEDLWVALLQAGVGTGYVDNSAAEFDADVATVNLEVVAQTGSAHAYIQRASGDWSSDGYAIGDWVRTSGFSNSENNSVFRVMAISTTDLFLAGENAMVAETAGQGDRLVELADDMVNGTTFDSFTIIRHNTDLGSDAGDGAYRTFTGCAPASAQLTVNPEAVVTGSFSFVGTGGSTSDTASLGTTVAANTNVVLNGIDHVVAVMEGYKTSSRAFHGQDITSFNFTFNNNLEPLTKVGFLGAFDVSSGTIDITGQIQAYLSDPDTANEVQGSVGMLTKFEAETESSLAIVFEDTAGNLWVLDFPRIKFTDAEAGTPGVNQQVIANMSFQALRDTQTGYTIKLAKLDAA